MWFKLLFVKVLLFLLTVTGQNQAVQDTISSLPPDLQAPAAAFVTQAATQVGSGNSATPEATLAASATPEVSATPAGTEASKVEFTGTVNGIGADAWVIGSQTVNVNAQTEIGAGIAVSDTVKVEAQLQADGALLAREIKPAEGQPEGTATPGAEATKQPEATEQAGATEAPEEVEVKFTGVVSAINGNEWTLDNPVWEDNNLGLSLGLSVNVTVTAETEIKDNPQIGSVVKVEALLQGDTLTAKSIETVSGSSGSGGDNHSGGTGGDQGGNSGGDSGDKDKGDSDSDH